MPVTSGHELSCFGLGFAFCCQLNPVAAVVHSGLLIGLKCCAGQSLSAGENWFCSIFGLEGKGSKL